MKLLQTVTARRPLRGDTIMHTDRICHSAQNLRLEQQVKRVNGKKADDALELPSSS